MNIKEFLAFHTKIEKKKTNLILKVRRISSFKSKNTVLCADQREDFKGNEFNRSGRPYKKGSVFRIKKQP